ncbi:MAG: mechanosensitive ion channel family protein, partial [Thermoplasmata archaeon]
YVGYRLFKDIIIYYGKMFAQKTESKLDDILIPVFEKVGMVVIILFAIAAILDYFSIDLTMFVAGGVVTSMVIAFAAQETLSNFFAGIFILIDRPFKEGDWVILPGDEMCRVEKIGLRSTKFYRRYDNTMIALPNNKLMSEKIVNFSEPDDIAKVRAKVGVAYGSDLKVVEDTLLSVAKSCPHVIKEGNMAPSVWIDRFGDSSIDFTLLTFVKNRDNRWDAEKFLLSNIYNEFKKRGIEIPFPQRVLHIVHEDKKENVQRVIEKVGNLEVKKEDTTKENSKKIDKKIS